MMDPVRIVAIQQYQGPADTIFDFQPPLSYLLVHAALAVSQSVLAARLPSLFAGLLSILGIGLFGAHLGGRRAGLAAAALAGLSLFHLDFSRAIKPYALFLCAQVFSIYFLARASERWRPRTLCDFAIASALMLSTAYQGVPTLMGEAFFLGILFFARQGIFAGKNRVWRLIAGIIAIDAAVLAWLPLAPGLLFIREFLDNPGVDPWRGLGPIFFTDVLNGLFHQHGAVPLACTLLLAGLIALGLGASRRAWAALLLVLAAGMPSLAVLSSHSDLRPLVSWRHLITLFPALAIFAGCGASWLAGRLAGLLPGRSRAPAALALTGVLIALVMAPSLPRYAETSRRTLSNDRDLFRFLSRLPVGQASLTFTGYQRNTKAFAARWHLPGRFDGPGDFDGPGYGRSLVVDAFAAPSQRQRSMPRGELLASWRLGMFSTRVALAGLPRLAPLLLAPDAAGEASYAIDFRDWRYYNEAFASKNFTVDTEVGLLRPTRYEVPATAVWRFDLPPGSAGASRVSASVVAALYKRHLDKAADALLTVEASSDGEHFTLLATLGHADFLLPDGSPRAVPRRFFEELGFYHECRLAVARVDLSRFAANGTVYLRLGYVPGVREGYMNVAGVAVTADVPPAAAPVDRLAFYAANLARNCAAPAYRPGESLVGQSAYVFAAPGHAGLAAPGQTGLATPGRAASEAASQPEPAGSLPDGGGVIGTPEELAAFEAAHPGLTPAYVLADAAGAPAVVVHDPGLAPDGGAAFLSDTAPRALLDVAAVARPAGTVLASPATVAPADTPPAATADSGTPAKADAPGPVPAAAPADTADTAATRDVGTVWIRGDFNGPTLAIGDTAVHVPVSAPSGSVLRLTPGGRGLLTFSPDFDPPDFTDRPNAHFQNMAASTSYPDYAGGVTCQPNTFCSFDYVLVSGLPISEVRVMAYPRLYGDASGQGSCRIASSTDGKTFETVLDYRNSEAGKWSEMFDRRFVRLRFPRPVTFVTLRFTLFANAQAEFWSPTRPVDRMLVEADLDARSIPPIRLGPGQTPVTLTGPTGNALLLTLDPTRIGRERVWPGD